MRVAKSPNRGRCESFDAKSPFRFREFPVLLASKDGINALCSSTLLSNSTRPRLSLETGLREIRVIPLAMLGDQSRQIGGYCERASIHRILKGHHCVEGDLMAV
jgi:hypothetical protein